MNPNFDLELAEWIKTRRTLAGLTSKDASRNLGLPIEKLEQYESGRAIPLRTLAGLVRLYKAAPEEAMAKVLEFSIARQAPPNQPDPSQRKPHPRPHFDIQT